MKIGILTFHRSINFGAFMQCFSLLTRLKKDFSDCVFEVVDFTPKTVINSYSNIIDQAKTEERRRQYTERARAFQEVYSYLNLSPHRLETDNYNEIADYLNQHYDAVIVGSDAVWNWITRGLYKFGLKSDTELWKCVYNKIDDFLKKDYSEEIFNKLNREAESYNSFQESLNSYISLKDK